MRSVELFAGCGGLALGLSRAGFQHDLVVEQDPQAFLTLAENKRRQIDHFADWPLLQADVRTVDYSSLEAGIDLVSGGPPCQPFSIGGKHRGANDPRNMWPEAIRAVRQLRPKAFIFENVRGLLRPAFNRYLEYIQLCLRWPEVSIVSDESWFSHYRRLQKHRKANRDEDASYNVVCRAINTADYGGGQKRNRAIIMGVRSDIAGSFDFPEPTHSRNSLIWSQQISDEYWLRHSIPSKRKIAYAPSDLLLTRLRASGKKPLELPWLTVRDAIADLPVPRKTPGVIENHVVRPGARSYRGHTGSRWDETAKALKAGDHGVPGGENTLASDNGSVRYFTLREMARLQGFPDDFVLQGSWKGPIKQIGNAVPVQIAELFGRRVAEIIMNLERKTALAA